MDTLDFLVLLLVYVDGDLLNKVSQSGLNLNSNKAKKTAVYCRVSTIDQHPESQELALRTYCENQNIVFDLFMEKESTRKTRPIKDELLNQIRMGEYNQLIIWSLSRYARSFEELINDMNQFPFQSGFIFISINDLGTIDLSTSMGRLIFRILSAFVEFDRDIISDNTRMGLDRARKEGKTLGRPPGSKDKKKRRKAGYGGNKNRKKKVK